MALYNNKKGRQIQIVKDQNYTQTPCCAGTIEFMTNTVHQV